jgi:hypothetical protein
VGVGLGRRFVRCHVSPGSRADTRAPSEPTEGSVAAGSLGVLGARSRLDPSNKRALTYRAAKRGCAEAGGSSEQAGF